MKFFKKKSATNITLDPEQLAAQFVSINKERADRLDYSVKSFEAVDEVLGEAADLYKAGGLKENEAQSLAQMAGFYIFEALRKQYGGTYKKDEAHNQLVLIIGEPDFSVALAAITKAKGRIVNGVADNIPFYIEGVVERIKAKKSALIV